jgi:hypothetical protein
MNGFDNAIVQWRVASGRYNGIINGRPINTGAEQPYGFRGDRTIPLGPH